MAATYFWTINPLEAYPTASGESDVVFTAHWQLHATETVGETTYTAQSIGTQGTWNCFRGLKKRFKTQIN